MPFKSLFAALLLLAASQFSSAQAADDMEAAGIASAEAWLALVDAGDYPASWQDAAVLFQEAVNPEMWAQTLAVVRRPLGAVQSRQLLSATHYQELPNAPPGDYVVIQFTTDFANHQGGVETVTPMLGPDGSWRVSGYYIK